MRDFPFTKPEREATSRHLGVAIRRRGRGIAMAVGLAVISVLVCAPRAARAEDDLILQGPHPFNHESSLTAQFLMGQGFGDSFSGLGVGVGYGYMLQGPLWLDLQLNFRGNSPGFFESRTNTYKGNDAEAMAGITWRFRTDVPALPYLRGAVGTVYAFPQSGRSAMGLGARFGAGIRYYVFDWLGFNLEFAVTAGRANFAADYAGSHTYAVGDLATGVEWQFQ